MAAGVRTLGIDDFSESSRDVIQVIVVDRYLAFGLDHAQQGDFERGTTQAIPEGVRPGYLFKCIGQAWVKPFSFAPLDLHQRRIPSTRGVEDIHDLANSAMRE
jgi:hypothetical protein